MTTFGRPQYAGDIQSSRLDDLSGIQASFYRDDLLWAESNRGHAKLFALSTSGEHLGSIDVNGTRNTDWEDITSFQRDGESYLLIADTGGNRTKHPRDYHDIVCVKEPVADADGQFPDEVDAEWTIRFTYEDVDERRPDCESIVADGERILLLLKEERRGGSRLFELPIPNASVEDQVAARVGKVTGIVETAEQLRHSKTKPTGMDIRSDGKLAIVLTSAHAYAFSRQSNEPWRNALTKEPQTVQLPFMLQPECICFSRSGNSFFVSSERQDRGRHAPLFEVPLLTQ